MKNLNNVRDFMRKNGRVSVPMLQREYSLSYSVARDIIKEYAEKGALRFVGGVYYEYRMTREERLNADRESISRRIEELEKQADFPQKSPFGEEDDEEIDEDELFNSLTAESLDELCAETAAEKGDIKAELRGGKKKVPHDEKYDRTLWRSKEEFNQAFFEELSNLITSDKRMGRQGALKKAREKYHKVFVTHERKSVDVYARIISELLDITDSEYRELKEIACS